MIGKDISSAMRLRVGLASRTDACEDITCCLLPMPMPLILVFKQVVAQDLWQAQRTPQASMLCCSCGSLLEPELTQLTGASPCAIPDFRTASIRRASISRPIAPIGLSRLCGVTGLGGACKGCSVAFQREPRKGIFSTRKLV